MFVAALQHLDAFSFQRLIRNKNVLHFAPERIIASLLRDQAARCVTADYLKRGCDMRLDISDMPQIGSQSFDIVIAFDVLEHVLDYRKALDEVHRVLSPGGFGIFTVPQKDHLQVTYEDPSVVTPEGRTEHFGQFDHLRIFGDDFAGTVQGKGFSVTAVDESMFPDDVRRKHVLAPPQLSTHPLATNYRKVFFCQKTQKTL